MLQRAASEQAVVMQHCLQPYRQCVQILPLLAYKSTHKHYQYMSSPTRDMCQNNEPTLRHPWLEFLLQAATTRSRSRRHRARDTKSSKLAKCITVIAMVVFKALL